MTEPSEPRSDDVTTPRWLYVVGSLVILAAVVFVVMHLASGGLVRH